MKHLALAAAVCCLTLFAGVAHAQSTTGLSDSEIRQQIVEQSVAAYLATGHPCACPYNSARNGSRCGGRSAYSKPGGADPLCYPTDVSDGMVAEWRREHSH
jgi:hypothetical protein